MVLVFTPLAFLISTGQQPRLSFPSSCCFVTPPVVLHTGRQVSRGGSCCFCTASLPHRHVVILEGESCHNTHGLEWPSKARLLLASGRAGREETRPCPSTKSSHGGLALPFQLGAGGQSHRGMGASVCTCSGGQGGWFGGYSNGPGARQASRHILFSLSTSVSSFANWR